MKYANNYLLGILIILLITVIITGAYAYNIERDPQKIIEIQNQERIRWCLEWASRQPSSEEILQATKSCNSDLFSKIISPHNSWSGKVNTWTLTPGISGVPLWKIKQKSPVVIAGILGKTTGEEILKKSQQISVGSAHLNNTFWIVYDLAIPLIQKYEWLNLIAYPDPDKDNCSIWWWTRARYCWQSISQSEADNRLWSIVKQVITRVQRNFHTLSARQQAWLVSFAYNCHKWYVDVEKHWLGQHKIWCKTAGWVKLKWLVARRNEEATLLFK